MRSLKLKSKGRKKQAKARVAGDPSTGRGVYDDTKKTKAEEASSRRLSMILLGMIGLPAIGSAIAFVFSYLSPTYVEIDVQDAAQLREVFFSGKPYLVACAPYKGQPVGEVFGALAANAWAGTEYTTATIDCDAKLPQSGKTVIQRFKLSSQKKYSRNELAFTVANGGKPKVVPAKYVQNKPQKKKKKKTGSSQKTSGSAADISTRVTALDEYVKKKVRVVYGKVTNAHQLKKSCLNKPNAAVVLTQGEPSATTLSAMEALVQRFRTVRFCTVDRSKYLLSVEKDFPDALSGDGLEEGDARLVVFRRGTNSKGKAKTLARPFLGTVAGPPDAASFLEEALTREGKGEMPVLSKSVTLRYRKSKKSKASKNKSKTKKKKATKKKKKKKKKDEEEDEAGDDDDEAEEVEDEEGAEQAAADKARRKRQRRERKSEAKQKTKEAEAAAAAAKKSKKRKETPQQQREREARIRRAMDQEAQKHYAQAADDEDDEDEGEDEEEHTGAEEDGSEDDYVETSEYEEDEDGDEDEDDDEDVIEL